MTILELQPQHHRHEAVPFSENDDDVHDDDDDEPDGLILNDNYGPLGGTPSSAPLGNNLMNSCSSSPFLYQYVPSCLKFQDPDHHHYHNDDNGETTSSSDHTDNNNTTTTSNHNLIIAEQQQQQQRQVQDLNLEATALTVSCYGRACLGMASLFLGPALLELAGRAAGCAPIIVETDDNADSDNADINMEECTNTIYGFRPSSLLTNLAAVSGLLGALLLPYAGSLVDHTPHRRRVGAVSGLLCVLVKACEAFVSQQTWMLVVLGQVVTAVLFLTHIVAHYAYVSELSRCPQRQARYNTTFSITIYVSTLLFMVQVIGISTAFHLGDVGTARVSQILTACTCGPTMYLAWVCWLPDRPAKKSVPDHQTLWSAGFYQLGRTLQQLWHRQHALAHLMGAIACGEAASNALVSVSTTYMKSVLRMNANQSTCVHNLDVCILHV